MTLADIIATLCGHGSAQVCTLTPRECAEMAAVLVRLRDEEAAAVAAIEAHERKMAEQSRRIEARLAALRNEEYP